MMNSHPQLTVISRTAEHALRAILYLAQREGGAPIPADVIADALDAPANYLSKTLNVLARHGIVSGVRGPRGGFVLDVPAAELRIADVIAVFAEPAPHTMCLLGGRRCNEREPCAAHERWTRTWAAAWAPLRVTTIQDLLSAEPVAPAS